jgi:exopolysaccharide biosynthesis polyprenyl glycosylphosphotransferase
MLGRKQEFNRQLQQILDGLLMVIAFWGAHTIRYLGYNWFPFDRPIGPFKEFQWLLFVIMPFGPIILELQGFYSHPLHKSLQRSLEQLGRTAFWLGLLIAGSSYFLKLDVPSRAVMPLFAVLGGTALLLRERITIARYRKRLKKEDLREPVVLAGTKADMYALRDSFTPEQIMEIKIVAEIDLEKQPVADLIAALHEHSVSRVLFAGGHSQLNSLQEAIAACETEGVEAWLVADFIRTSIARPDFDIFGTRPMLVFRTTPDLSWALLVKHEIMDRLGSLLGLVLAAPLFVVIAAAIRFTSPGPIIFRQQRSGKNGKPFTMYKFRSMRTDAEMQRDELIRFNVMTGPVFKLEQDPRVTGIGRFLRKTSFDELPQLLNVLKGDMSLVGPRPLPIYEVEQFASTSQRRRLSMKPGITCLWQVSGRNEVTDFDEWVKLDLQYIDNWSLWLDLQILLKTIPVVLFGWGAR